MAEAAPLAWPDDLGYGTITGRVLYADGDSADVDREPDLNSASGRVAVMPSVTAFRYSGTKGPALLIGRRVDGVLDSEGYLCTPGKDGKAVERGLVVAACDDAQLTPTDFTYQVTITIEGGYTQSFSIKVPTGATVDLATVAPVASSGGTAVVIDTATAERAVAAAQRAETVAAGLDEAISTATATATQAATKDLDTRISTAAASALAGKASIRTATVALAAGASAGTVTVSQSGSVVVAECAGLVLTGTSELAATIPAGMAPARPSGHGWLSTAAGEWWACRATTSSIEILGPAPVGTTVEGTLTWRIS